MLKRVEERLALAGSDKLKILIAQVWIGNVSYFEEMNSVWDAWVDQDSPPDARQDLAGSGPSPSGDRSTKADVRSLFLTRQSGHQTFNNCGG